ncbi:hypothetical protein T484DRAFT_1823836 [Baffinella frigidus]|nr:hypothetical protein T484DRAFT_1823836 [Cryptophyta sp. CCMP2293]
MVAQLQNDEQDNFIGFLHTLGAGDGRAAADFVLKFSKDQTCVSEEDIAAFQEAMRMLFLETCKGYGHNVDIGMVLRRVLQTLRLHKVRIDVNYATLVLNLLCLEGLAGALQPDYSLLDGSKPLLEAYRIIPWPFNPDYSLLDGSKPLLEAYRIIPWPLNRVLFPIHDKNHLATMRRDREREDRKRLQAISHAGAEGGISDAVHKVLVPAAFSAGASAVLLLLAGLMRKEEESPGFPRARRTESRQSRHGAWQRHR